MKVLPRPPFRVSREAALKIHWFSHFLMNGTRRRPLIRMRVSTEWMQIKEFALLTKPHSGADGEQFFEDRGVVFIMQGEEARALDGMELCFEYRVDVPNDMKRMAGGFLLRKAFRSID